jgi:hypothetical protein
MIKPIEIPILNNEYKVIVCFGDKKDIKKVLKDWKYEKEFPEWNFVGEKMNKRGLCFYEERCHPVIALPKFPKTPEEIGTLSHEAFHAINDIFNKINEDIRDEVFAISIGAVVRIVLESGKERRKRKRHK